MEWRKRSCSRLTRTHAPTMFPHPSPAAHQEAEVGVQVVQRVLQGRAAQAPARAGLQAGQAGRVVHRCGVVWCGGDEVSMGWLQVLSIKHSIWSSQGCDFAGAVRVMH